LIRFGGIFGGQTTIADWTTLHPLFWGAIWGILIRELLLGYLGRGKIPADPSDKDPIRRRMALNPSPGLKDKFWLEPEIWFVFFISILSIERMLAYFPWSFKTGISFAEGFYIPNLSYREAFGLSWNYWDNLIPVVWYFFTEERCTRDLDNPAKHWLLGLTIAFVVQIIFVLDQTYFINTMGMVATGESVKSLRVAGLFKDSGSASWMLPSIAFYLTWKVVEKRGIWRESSRRLILFSILIFTGVAGLKLGKTFWFIYIVGILGFIFYFISKKIKHPNLYIQKSLQASALIFVILFGFSIIWFGENQKKILSLSNASIVLKNLVEGKDLSSIDPNRTILMKASLDLWKEGKFFGQGLGSMVVHLKNPKSSINIRHPEGFVDSPANFYLGWIGETGILGTFVLIFYIALKVYLSKNAKYLIILVIPFMTGYQITHSDGAFLALFFIFGTRVIENSRSKLQKHTNILKNSWIVISIGISLHYLVYALLRNI
jgi:hypothetical protein